MYVHVDDNMNVHVIVTLMAFFVIIARRLFPPHESSTRAQHEAGKGEGIRARGMQRRVQRETKMSHESSGGQDVGLR